ncbi:MAG: hypothetical protein PHH85_14525 [Candidatus Methanoperedens sp.]|nr:hypothetical protein [Candidatus Methanoperedens sp.]
MKQQDMYKILAFFLAFTMIFSIFAYIFINPRDDTQQETVDKTKDYYDPEFWTFEQPFNSISDALNITPPGAESASYVDLEKMTPQMAEWTRQTKPILNEVDTIYKSNTTKMYYSDLKYDGNSSFLLLSTMDPLKNDFQYMFIDSYYDHPLLVRQEGGLQGLYNVMGTPVMLAPPKTAIDVIDITTSLNETVTSYDGYKGMLNLVPYAPFQTITSNVTFAKQFYMGVDQNNDSYERTTGYLDVNSSVMKKLDQLKTNSTQKGFSQYNITKTGNYTVVKVSGKDMYAVLMEEVN